MEWKVKLNSWGAHDLSLGSWTSLDLVRQLDELSVREVVIISSQSSIGRQPL